MEKLKSLSEAENKVLSDIEKCLTVIRVLVQRNPASVFQGIETLRRLRQAVYEDINQIQHEAMILMAVKYLENADFKENRVDWYWNPRQTGDISEPDLRGIIDGKIALSAEITTSEQPVGTIDKRMVLTIKNLSEMPGKRYYFVRTDSMDQRARTKVGKGGYAINVVKIE